MLATYTFRPSIRTRRTDAPDCVVVPERQFCSLRQRVPLGQCQYPVNFGLRTREQFAGRAPFCRRATSIRVNLGLRRVVSPAQTGPIHIHRLPLASEFHCGAEVARRDKGLIVVIL
jgi:hypothetical protein